MIVDDVAPAARPEPAPRGFDFFEAGELAVPTLGAVEVAGHLFEQFGLTAQVEPLGSQQDQNFIVCDSARAPIAILKIAHPAFSREEIGAQDAAADVIAGSGADVRVATVLRDASEAPLSRIVDTTEGPLHFRLLRFLGGGTMMRSGYLSPAVIARMGELAARTSLALHDFDHPGLDRTLQWNLVHAERVIDSLAGHHPDAGRRELVREAARAALAEVTAVATDLPIQPGHFDLTDDNLVYGPESGLPDGIIDFGDLSRSWAVAELAVTISSVLHHPGGEPHAVLPAVREFHRRRPLSPAEIRALWPLVVLRGAVLVVSGEHQLTVDAHNDYAAAAIDREWRIFERATSIPSPVMTSLFFEALQLGAPRSANPATHGTLVPRLDGALKILDLSVASDAADRGGWLDPGLAERTAHAALAGGTAAVVTPFAAARIDASRALSSASPPTIPTAVDVWFRTPASLTSPFDGVVIAEGPVTIVRHRHGDLVLEGLRSRIGTGSTVAVGDVLGTTDRVRIQGRLTGAPEVPALVRPEYAPGWLAQVTDPTSWIHADAAALAGAQHAVLPAGALLERRAHALAEVQEHYYTTPPRIERGWRHHLIDVDGRAYLDMVNNVTALGHAHPRVADAVAGQLNRLNTNSRFHYEAIVEFCERIAATLPDPLDTVFLVNSGSEAVDLALRIAMAATGRRDVVALREAYHGWTFASDAVSTSVADNPNAMQTRPDWVHTVDSPNSFRGLHRGGEAGNYALEAASIIAGLAASGRAPAAFLAETVYGNAGGIALPNAYLGIVYEAVRAAGGLAIADEVQVGYGRLGEWFWGFEQQNVVPDIVAVAKSMGNGHPLGAVITSRAVADMYRTQGYFFSSTGGSPVSSVVGLTVLDVIRDERLQENALAIGAHLKGRLSALRAHHPTIGAVHGSGLYLGVELVRDRETLDPATAETAALCDRLLELGIIVQPTGDHLNVLKIKPPLCIDRAAADFFVAGLDRAMEELGY